MDIPSKETIILTSSLGVGGEVREYCDGICILSAPYVRPLFNTALHKININPNRILFHLGSNMLTIDCGKERE